MKGQGHSKHYANQETIQGTPVIVSNTNNNLFKDVKDRKPEKEFVNDVVKGTLGNKRERARRINEFLAWEFYEDNIKGLYSQIIF